MADDASEILSRIRSSGGSGDDSVGQASLERVKAGKPKDTPSLWESLKTFVAESGSALADAGRQIPKEAGELVSDLVQSRTPTAGGREAAGRVAGKVGDIGTFMSGGLTGPMGMPTPPAAGLVRGLDQRMPAARPLGGQLALPPPRVATPGAPAVGTGQGLIPEGPRATMTAPSATPAAAAMGKPAAPLIPPGTEAGTPSRFASAFFENNPEPIDRALTKSYRRTINPKAPDQRTGQGMDMQNQRIMTAVDSIIDAKDTLRFKDMQGTELPAGRTPRSIDEFIQGVDHLKDQIFEQYDTLAKQQGGKGVQVPLGPAIAKLQELASEPQVSDLHPGLVQQAAAQAEAWAKRGSYSPKEMQAVVQHLNEELKSQIKSPTRETPTRNAMMAQVLGTLRETLNQTMETALQGPQYQSLRTRYGALSSIEGDLVNALRQQEAKGPGRGLAENLTDPVAAVSALHGVFFHDLRSLGFAGAAEGAKYLRRYLNSPNRAVTQMFSKRASALSPSVADRLSAKAADRLGDLRQQRYDAIRTGDLLGANRLAGPLSRAQTDVRDLGR